MSTTANPVNPAAIARGAIRRLAASRIAPTPENFTRAYREEAGDETEEVASTVDPEQVLIELVQGMVARRPDLGSAFRLQEHVLRSAWSDALKSVGETVNQALAAPSREWPRVLQQLLGQLDNTHADWSRARKLGAVRHILLTPSTDDRTREKLESLMAAWANCATEPGGLPVPRATASCLDDGAPTAIAAEARGTSAIGRSSVNVDRTAEVDAWRLLALTALHAGPPRAGGQGGTSPGNGAGTFAGLAGRLETFAGIPGADWIHAIRAAAAEDLADAKRQTAARDRLIKLLRLVCENLALFADEGAWVHGQVARISKLLDAPLDERSLSEAEDSLRLAVQRQTELNADVNLVKAAVKEMLASMIDRLGAATATAGEFHDRIGERAEAIRRADDLPSLSRVVANLLDDAIAMREGMQETHGELTAALDSAHRYESRVHALEQELSDVSSLVRLDPLTQVLNRRGLEEVFAIEQSRASRDGLALAVAMLDIDNFKNLNDTLGHQAGDLALKHLCAMVRNAVRPSDTVARYGGEEFVILLPGTLSAEAADILTRVQRQLTRAFFLHNAERVLMTFSAGATECATGEDLEAVIRRADGALLAAKAAGKNRVHTA